jgi:hypothetical protein
MYGGLAVRRSEHGPELQRLQMRRRIAVAEGMVGYDIQASFNGRLEALVQGGEVGHVWISYGF